MFHKVPPCGFKRKIFGVFRMFFQKNTKKIDFSLF